MKKVLYWLLWLITGYYIVTILIIILVTISIKIHVIWFIVLQIYTFCYHWNLTVKLIKWSLMFVVVFQSTYIKSICTINYHSMYQAPYLTFKIHHFMMWLAMLTTNFHSRSWPWYCLLIRSTSFFFFPSVRVASATSNSNRGDEK